MAMYFVQPVEDLRGNKQAWEVAKKHGRGTRRISDHRKKAPAIKSARRERSEGDSVAIKSRNGVIQRWL